MGTDGLRLATEADALAIAGIYAPSVTSSVTSFELVAPGTEEMATRIRTVLHDSEPGRLSWNEQRARPS
jgi:L-amino acid N-acyltransferase YncA